jgi:hypothetical protein
VSGLEPASFEVERFELRPDACLEVRGRWSGVRGRRFIRPTLTAVAGEREHRLLAVLDHKPWIAEEGEAWLAAFPWSTDPAALGQAELTVAPDVTVPLPPLSAAGRRRRAGPRRSSARSAGAPGKASEPDRGSKNDGAKLDGRLALERDAALRSREEALVELDAVKRDRDRMGDELGEALLAREAASAERHDAIDAEVRQRTADLRAETERGRAAAGQAAQVASERDRARSEHAEAISERDEAHTERDAARVERDRMLAQRDTARSQAKEAMRRWEATAALGTRRTEQRDAAVSERDRVARARDSALEQRDRATRERDDALGERDRMARERDAVLEQREQAREQITVAVERAVAEIDLEHQQTFGDEDPVAGGQPTEARPATAETGAASRASAGSAGPSAPISPATDTPRRPRKPPAPPETPPRRNAIRGEQSSSSLHGARALDESEMWRARLLAIAALIGALVVFVVILIAK